MTDATQQFRGWIRPGPMPPGATEAEADETLDYLAGHFRIFQYAKGHRYSVDDALTAWYGSTWAPRVERALDLGSGISSVALFVAWRLPGAHLVTVEAQKRSLRLARKSVQFNGLADRFTQLEGDFRETQVLENAGAFDLVTGTPPYWPTDSKTQAEHPQAVPARLEVRGDVSDYAKCAARHLAPGGVFAFCLPNDQRDKALHAIHGAGLVLLRRRDAIFKEGEPYGIGLYLAGRESDFPAALQGRADVEPPILLRTKDGFYSDTYALIRVSYGFPPGQIAPEGNPQT